MKRELSEMKEKMIIILYTHNEENFILSMRINIYIIYFFNIFYQLFKTERKKKERKMCKKITKIQRKE